MGDNFPKKVIDSLEDECNQSLDENGINATLSSLLDDAESNNDITNNDLKDLIKIEILESCSNSANIIFQSVINEEESKAKWRKFFIVFFSILLVISFIFSGTLIVLNATEFVVVNNEIIMGLFVYVIANIFTILYFMIKYTNNSRYLDMFKTVSHKMLDFLIQDK